MIKFKITPERVASVCGTVEYVNLTFGDKATVFRVAPRFAVDEQGEYMMTPVYDDDGDIKEMKFYAEALAAMSQVTPKRLEKLTDEFSEAARAIINPPNGKD